MPSKFLRFVREVQADAARRRVKIQVCGVGLLGPESHHGTHHFSKLRRQRFQDPKVFDEMLIDSERRFGLDSTQLQLVFSRA